MSVASWCSTCFCVLCVGFCTGHFVMVPLNLTYLHCLQHSVFEHLFNLYYMEKNYIMMIVFCYAPRRVADSNQLVSQSVRPSVRSSARLSVPFLSGA